MSGHARPWDLKPRQRNLTPVLRRPVEPALRERTNTRPPSYVRLVPRATERIAANSALFDHFVSQQLHRYRYIDAERLGGLHVDDQLEPGGLLDGEVGGLGALEDLVHVHRAAPKQVVAVGPICDQTADLHKLASLGHGRQSVPCGKRDK